MRYDRPPYDDYYSQHGDLCFVLTWRPMFRSTAARNPIAQVLVSGGFGFGFSSRSEEFMIADVYCCWGRSTSVLVPTGCSYR
jgi:hypothetical protein